MVNTMEMFIYKVDADFTGYLLTSVVASTTETEAINTSDFVGADYSEQEAVKVGIGFYEKPTLICAESL